MNSDEMKMVRQNSFGFNRQSSFYKDNSMLVKRKGSMTMDRKTLADGDIEGIESYKKIETKNIYGLKTSDLFINPEVTNVLSAHVLTN